MQKYQQRPDQYKQNQDFRIYFIAALVFLLILLGILVPIFSSNSSKNQREDSKEIEEFFHIAPLDDGQIEEYIQHGFPALKSTHSQYTPLEQKGLAQNYIESLSSLLQSSQRYLDALQGLKGIDLRYQYEQIQSKCQNCLDDQKLLRQQENDVKNEINMLRQQKIKNERDSFNLDDLRKELKQLEGQRNRMEGNREDLLNQIEILNQRILRQQDQHSAADLLLLRRQREQLEEKSINQNATIQRIYEKIRLSDLEMQRMDDSDYLIDQKLAANNTQSRQEKIYSLERRIAELKDDLHNLQSRGYTSNYEELRALIETKQRHLKEEEQKLYDLLQFENSSSQGHKHGLSAPGAASNRRELEIELKNALAQQKVIEEDLQVIIYRIQRAEEYMKELNSLRHKKEALEQDLKILEKDIQAKNNEIFEKQAQLNRQLENQLLQPDIDERLRILEAKLQRRIIYLDLCVDIKERLGQTYCADLQRQLDNLKDKTQKLAGECVMLARNIKKNKGQVLSQVSQMTNGIHQG